MPDKTLNPSIPGGDVLTLNGGIGYDWEHFSLGFGYQAIFYKTRNVKNGELEGAVPPGLPFAGAPGKDQYRTFNNFLTLSAGYRF
jgi:long-subunit fatty acid transport protein